MATHGQYERPTITTIPANRILEMMGPVSAGSDGVFGALPVGGFESMPGGGGYRDPSF